MKEEPNTIIDEAEEYLQINLELYTLRMTDKLASVISAFFSRLVIGLLVFLVVFMLTMGFAFWIGHSMGNTYSGFLIVGGVLGVLTIVVYIRRYKMIRKPMMDAIVSQVLK